MITLLVVPSEGRREGAHNVGHAAVARGGGGAPPRVRRARPPRRRAHRRAAAGAPPRARADTAHRASGGLDYARIVIVILLIREQSLIYLR